MKNKCLLPLDVPSAKITQFKKRYALLTKNSSHIFLFAGDQIMEHLSGTSPDTYFALSEQGHFGAFAVHYGIANRYGAEYKIPLIIKLNGKTNLKNPQEDPESLLLAPWEAVVELVKEHDVPIIGVGYTIYLGSKYEAQMLHEAATYCYKAHQEGLLFIAWIYPRASHITEITPAMIAGAAGVANSIGADVVKLSLPGNKEFTLEELQQIKKAAGNTQLIYAGGPIETAEELLKRFNFLLSHKLCDGFAIGRNIINRPSNEQKPLINALHALIYHQEPIEKIVEQFKKKN